MSKRLSPATTISLGLITMAVTLVFIADFLVGFLPDEDSWTEDAQMRTAESLAIQTGVIVDNPEILQRTIRAIAERDSSILSMALRDASGKIIAVTGEHEKTWQPFKPGDAHQGRFAVPVLHHASRWGDMEVRFRAPTIPAWERFMRSPSLRIAGILVSFGLLGYFFYLRRVLQQLDPSSVIPERVRMAFDVLTEGVMVLDSAGKVVLTNQAFQQLTPNEESVVGRRPSELRWLVATIDKDPNMHPWYRAMRERRAITGDELEISGIDGALRRSVVNCAPILDSANVVRGCLVTLDDVTALHHANNELIRTVQQLNVSQLEIERQNEELTRLATRDPMTGCLNRRAFFEAATPIFEEARLQEGRLCCIMCDIDHFKRFNDQYGHTVGDQVIVATSKALAAGLRSFDLFCRYGGEEFCILLPNTEILQAMEIAERLRHMIEQSAGLSVRTMEGLKVTSSFGVSTMRANTAGLGGLIDQADEALYASKQNGRNRVSLWAPPLSSAAAATESSYSN